MKSEKLKVKNQSSGFAFRFSLFTFRFSLSCVLALIFFSPIAAQTVAILAPDKAESSVNFAETLQSELAGKLKILDDSLSETAYLSTNPATPFNLTIEESKRIGSVIGCDFIIFIRAASQRRSAFQRAEYYESYAAIYVVSSRTGRLAAWKLQRFEAAKPERAKNLLDESAAALAAEIATDVREAEKKEIAEPAPPIMEEVPDQNSAAAKNFRAPVPYRRVKPEYTTRAALYDVKATVDLLVDLDGNGTILRTEIARWAGFGLDESVEKTVRQMNWRPATRSGKPLPMRFLLRYNFKKIEKE